jgi:hypothetical protein
MAEIEVAPPPLAENEPPRPAPQQPQLSAEERINQRLTQLEESYAARLNLPRPVQGLPKIKAPRTWDGRSDFLRNFQLPVQAYLDYYNITEDRSGVQIASFLLPEPYQSAYMSYARNPSNPQPTTFTELCALIRLWHPEPNRQTKAMAELDNLRHKPGHLADYTREFSVLVTELREVLTAWQVKYKYTKGLSLKMQEAISGKFDLETSTITDIVQQATAAECRQFDLHNVRLPRQYLGKFLPGTTFSNGDAFTRYTADGPTPMEVNRAEFKGFCYACRKFGHKSNVCPNKQRGNRGRPAAGNRLQQPPPPPARYQAKK